MIRENILKIKARIASICARLNRDPDLITIVVVSKERTLEQIKEVITAGITDIGENRVQEALSKYYEITKQRNNETTSQRNNETTIKWHMVGHLQTNKVKEAVKIFDLIQSVDSLRLAAEIDRQAAKINKIQDILVEVNTSLEATKFGLKPEAVIEFIKEIAQSKNIKIKGLMTIAPIVDNPEKTRPYFKILKELRDNINELRTTNYELRTLSMGMTDDFEVAIEEGANMVRLGRAIFG
jgi:pyridoxal phosphate enzyme (YggS family)